MFKSFEELQAKTQLQVDNLQVSSDVLAKLVFNDFKKLITKQNDVVEHLSQQLNKTLS